MDNVVVRMALSLTQTSNLILQEFFYKFCHLFLTLHHRENVYVDHLYFCRLIFPVLLSTLYILNLLGHLYLSKLVYNFPNIYFYLLPNRKPLFTNKTRYPMRLVVQFNHSFSNFFYTNKPSWYCFIN